MRGLIFTLLLILSGCVASDVAPCLVIPVRIEVQHDAAQAYHNAKERALAVFLHTQGMYRRDLGIELRLSRLTVWNTPDPYAAKEHSVILAKLGDLTDWDTITVVMGRTWGGMAYLSSRTGPAYSMLADTSITFNSWYLAHEIGHILGAEHKHAEGCSIMYGRPCGKYVPEQFSPIEADAIKLFTVQSCDNADIYRPGGPTSI